MDWFRWHHGTTTDPKWRLIARRSGQPLTAVIAVWAHILEHTSESEDRGSVDGWNDEVAAAALDLDPESVAAIRQAMEGLTLAGDRVTGWDKRQPKREDGTAAERKRRQRSRDAVSRNVTQGHAPEKRREEEIREEDSLPAARRPAVLELHRKDDREETISAIIRAANRGMADNEALDEQLVRPILPGHGSRQNVADWLADGVPADLAASVVYERAKEYRPDGSRRQISTMGYFTGAIRDADAKRRAKMGEAPGTPGEPQTPEQEWKEANPADYEALERQVRARLEAHESFSRTSEGVRKTMLQDAIRSAIRKRINAATQGLTA